MRKSTIALGTADVPPLCEAERLQCLLELNSLALEAFESPKERRPG
jgi:hypothetical protein